MKGGVIAKRRFWWGAIGGVALIVAALWIGAQGDGTPLSLLLRGDQTWQGIKARGTVRVGLDPSFPPFEFLDDKSAPVGLDVDLAQALAAQWRVKPEFVAIGFDSLVDALKATKVDVIISAYPYDSRLTRDVAFSQPYFDAGLRLAVRSGSAVLSSADLANKQVAVEWGSVGDMVGRQLERDGVKLTLVPFETPQAAVAALIERSDIDALLIDNVTLRQAQENGADIVGIGAPLESNPYVIVSSMRAPELQKAIDASLKEMGENGTIAALEKQWFSRPVLAGTQE